MTIATGPSDEDTLPTGQSTTHRGKRNGRCLQPGKFHGRCTNLLGWFWSHRPCATGEGALEALVAGPRPHKRPGPRETQQSPAIVGRKHGIKPAEPSRTWCSVNHLSKVAS